MSVGIPYFGCMTCKGRLYTSHSRQTSIAMVLDNANFSDHSAVYCREFISTSSVVSVLNKLQVACLYTCCLYMLGPT